MSLRRAFFVLALAMSAAADDSDGIHAVLHDFNAAARKPDRESMRRLFTPQADYRDGVRSLNGPEAIVKFLASRQVWSELSPPMLQEQNIKFVGQSAALVDARLVQYGSMIVKSGIPVVLLVEKEEGVWRISSWRMPSCAYWPSPD